MIRLIWVVFACVLVTAPAFAHGGGLDSYGCHNNRKAGGYHCHRGPLAGQSFSTKEEMFLKLKNENAGSSGTAADKR